MLNSLPDLGKGIASASLRSEKALGLPVHLTIEPTNVCQLHCPVCETGNGTLKRPKGYMKLKEFKTVLANVGRQVNTLLLYYMGEPLLNQNIYSMIEYAKRMRKMYVSVCTNGERVDSHALVGSGVSEISFQIGGMEDTHGVYRSGGHWDTTVKNMVDTVAIRNRTGSTTRIVVGFIVMRHNEHQVRRAVDYFLGLGADKVQIINPCVRTIEQGRVFLPADEQYWIYDRAEFAKGVLTPKRQPRNRCWWQYFSTVVCWNGDVVPCCRDVNASWPMGNALRQDFRSEIWNGGQYRFFRKQIRERQAEMEICRLCSDYGVPLLR